MDRVVVIGASGGVGGAMAAHAEARGAEVIRVSRPEIDLDRPESIEAAAERAGGDLDHVIVATGLLHRDGRGPERSFRDLDHDWLVEMFRVNAVLPALLARAFLPRLARDRRAVFAALSARVGSIGDNRLGGWHGYRAAKAALNQLIRTLSVEMQRRNPGAILVSLHPGTVDTAMSKPFQRNVPPARLFPPEVAAAHLWRVIGRLRPEDTGGFFAWDGQPIPW